MTQSLSADTLEIRKARWMAYALFAVCLFFYSFSFFKRVHRPIAQDELYYLEAAKTLYQTGIPVNYLTPNQILNYSPPLYLYSIKAAFSFFGAHESVARLVGFVSGWSTLLLMFVVIRTLIHDSEWEKIKGATLGCLLYGSTPAFIQGSLMLDIDNTVLPPIFLLLLLSFVKYQQRKTLRWALLIGIAVALALGVKLTTPVLAIALLGLFSWVGKNSLRTKLIPMAAILGGTLAFFLLWFLYSKVTGVSFLGPFRYVLNIFQYRSHSEGGLRLSQIAENFVYLALWLGPFPLLLFTLLAIRRTMGFLELPALKHEDLFLIFGLVIVGGYTLIGGAPFGFIKYHCPGIPMMYVFTAVTLQKKGAIDFSKIPYRTLLFLIGAALLIHFFTLNDLLYVLRYQLREAAGFSLPSVQTALFKNVGLKGFLYLLSYAVLSIAAFRRFSIKSASLLLLLFSLGSNVAMAHVQNFASYSTGYNYGATKTLEAARLIRERAGPKSVVIVPSDLVYYSDLPLSSSPHLLDRLWNDIEELTKLVADPRAAVFAYSISSNTVEQIRAISRYPPLQDLLRREFDPSTIGSYRIWIRKK